MIRQLNDHAMVSGQIDPAQVAELKAQGVTMIVNNRPDDEDPGQPSGAEVAAAALAAGIDYRHIPIARGMGHAEVEAMRGALRELGDGKLLAFCRSGQRSVLAWAIARNEDGAKRNELDQCAARAGFSLEAIDHLLRD